MHLVHCGFTMASHGIPQGMRIKCKHCGFRFLDPLFTSKRWGCCKGLLPTVNREPIPLSSLKARLFWNMKCELFTSEIHGDFFEILTVLISEVTWIQEAKPLPLITPNSSWHLCQDEHFTRNGIVYQWLLWPGLLSLRVQNLKVSLVTEPTSEKEVMRMADPHLQCGIFLGIPCPLSWHS